MEYTARRVSALIALVVYIGGAVWAYAFSKNIEVVFGIFIPVSVLIWFVLRALLRKDTNPKRDL